MTRPPVTSLNAVTVTLASQSPARAALLTAAGVAFTAVRAGVDEDAVKAAMTAEGATPRDVADALAELKAVRVSARTPGLVIGADQTLDMDGALISKADTVEAARVSLQALRGRPHTLYSAVVVARDGAPIWREVATARMHVRAFSDAFLDDYLAAAGEAVLETVGGYKVEGRGLQLFERIEGDWAAILGLPMLGLLALLRRHEALTS